MKKVLGTTLMILAFAMASTADAKQLKRIPAAEPTKTDLKNMVNDSKALLDPSVDMAQKKGIANGLLQDLEAAGLLEYSKLLVDRKRIANELEAAKSERDATTTGWLFNSAERNEANKKVAALNTELRDVNKQIRAMEAQQPKETSNTAKLAVASIVTVIGVLAAAEYVVRGEASIVRKAGIYTGEKIGKAGAAMERTYRKYAPRRFGGNPAVNQ